MLWKLSPDINVLLLLLNRKRHDLAERSGSRRTVGVGELNQGGPKVRISSYKINKYWGCNVLHVTIANNAVWYI